MHPSLRAQNPDEPFDVVSADGELLGYTKPRGAVHRDGDWHRAVHVWVYGERDSGPFLLFQRRGQFKDTAAGRLDPTVGGHYGAGETLTDIWREVEEEIGVEPDLPAMRFAGVRVRSSEGEAGVIDRELQDVFLSRRDQPLADYAPNPAELKGLVEVRVADILGVFSGAIAPIPAHTLGAENRSVTFQLLDPNEFLPSIDRYPYRVAVAVLAALRGDDYIAV